MRTRDAGIDHDHDDREGIITVTGFQASERPLIGNSAAMESMRRLIERVAPTDAAALICGASGCGKQYVAEALHAAGSCATGPLVAIDCGAISPTQLEAELFGCVKGSGTDASQAYAGVFERAHGGTVLLDEITEMPLEMQARLLRVLETGRVRRVGAESEVPVNARILAAASRCPVEAVGAGRLHKDLYYRLAVVLLLLPPLRDRIEDIPLLADHFLAQLNRRHGVVKRFSDDMRAMLAHHDWPGNVRQLRDCVERAFAHCDEVLEADKDSWSALAPASASVVPGRASRHAPLSITLPIGSALDDIERTFIVATLEHFNGDKRLAASALGCSVKTLYNKLHLYRRQLGHFAAAS